MFSCAQQILNKYSVFELTTFMVGEHPDMQSPPNNEHHLLSIRPNHHNNAAAYLTHFYLNMTKLAQLGIEMFTCQQI